MNITSSSDHGSQFKLKLRDLLKEYHYVPVSKIQALFSKNLLYLRPEFERAIKKRWLEAYSIENVCTKLIPYMIKKSLKHFFIKVKISLIWLLVIYEFFTGISPENLAENDWIEISSCIYKTPTDVLKQKWFSCIKVSYSNKMWTPEQDSILLQIIRKNPKFSPSSSYRYKWAEIAIEMNKEIKDISQFKTNKLCKERWDNHLNPSLKKKSWTSADDIKLLEENLSFPRKWSHIARKIPGRNQHQIKNRLITLVAKDSSMQRKKAEIVLRDEKKMISMCRSTLENLKRMQDEQMVYEFSDENSSENNEEILKNQTSPIVDFPINYYLDLSYDFMFGFDLLDDEEK